MVAIWLRSPHSARKVSVSACRTMAGRKRRTLLLMLKSTWEVRELSSEGTEPPRSAGRLFLLVWNVSARRCDVWNCMWLVFNVGHGCCYATEGHMYALPLLNHPFLPRRPLSFRGAPVQAPSPPR